MIALLLALVQAPAPTVGDTIWVERVTTLPPGHVARLPEWNLEGDVELLGQPVLVPEGSEVALRFPLVAWRPGTHTVTVPGPELIGPDGRTVTIPPEVRILEVASVLPDEPAEDIPIQDAAGIVGRPVASLVPLAALLVLAGLLLAPAWWWWVRRGPVTAGPEEQPAMVPVPVDRWAGAGEHRAVLAAATDTVRHAIASDIPSAHAGLDTDSCVAAMAASAPVWDQAPVVAILRDLDLARFRPEGPREVLALCRRAEEVAGRMAGVRAPA